MFIEQRKKNIDCNHNFFRTPAKREPLIMVESPPRQRRSKLDSLRRVVLCFAYRQKIFAIAIDIR
jgi:hypothetical protein